MTSGRSWNSLRDGPWPRVHTGGELGRTEREWLHTNGAGAYAMSTLSFMHTRRYHGILVAAFDPPIGQHVMLSHAETTLEVGRKTYRLSTHQFPGVAPTPGYRLLEQFAMDPLPRWVFKVGEGRFERSLFLVPGQNTVVLSYTWFGNRPARLSVKPLMPLRPRDALTREHGGMIQLVSLRPGVVQMRPRADLPPMTFQHEGVFMGSPDWWRRFAYLGDVGHRDEIEEDLWTPGVFEVVVQPHQTVRLAAALGELPTESLPELERRTIASLSAADTGPEVRPAVRALSVAAQSFSCPVPGRASVIAGYPWYDVIARDALIAVPGLYLSAGRVEAAKDVLRALLKWQHSGFLPSCLPRSDRARVLPCPDASLWLFHTSRELEARLDPDDAFLRHELYPALRRVFLRVRSRRRHLMWLSDEGLVSNRAETRALTWMDAVSGKEPCTPRRGLAIEHQALWFQGTKLLTRLALRYDEPQVAEAAEKAAAAVQESFAARFWNPEQDFPFDCVSELPEREDSWTDSSVRPNAVMALAIEPELFEAWQREAIVRRAQRDLLTPRGLRTLAPTDPNYVGQFLGDRSERESSVHQGCAWPFLLGFYARALCRCLPDEEQLCAELEALIEGVADDGGVLGQVATFADGDMPGRPQGCPTSAISVAELLHALVVDLPVRAD